MKFAKSVWGLLPSAFFNRTQAFPLRPEMTESAFAAVFHQRGDDVSLDVYLEESLGLGRFPALRAHERRVRRIVALEELYLGLVERGSAVADNAASAFADLVVASEIFSEDVLLNEAVVYLYYRTESIVSHNLRQ